MEESYYSKQEITEVKSSEEEYKEPADEWKEAACEIEEYRIRLKKEAEREAEEYRAAAKEQMDGEIEEYKEKEIDNLIACISQKKNEWMESAEREVFICKEKWEKAAKQEVAEYEDRLQKEAERKVEEYKKTKEEEFKHEAESIATEYWKRMKINTDLDIAHYKQEQMEKADKLCQRKKKVWEERICGANLNKFDKAQWHNMDAIADIRKQIISIDRKLENYMEELIWNNVEKMFEQFCKIYDDIACTRDGYMREPDYAEKDYLQNFADNLECTLEMIDDCMQNVGIFSFESKEGDKINFQRQECSDKRGSIVARSIQKGFEWHNVDGNRFRILQKEKVEAKEDENACRN